MAIATVMPTVVGGQLGQWVDQDVSVRAGQGYIARPWQLRMAVNMFPSTHAVLFPLICDDSDSTRTIEQVDKLLVLDAQYYVDHWYSTSCQREVVSC